MWTGSDRLRLFRADLNEEGSFNEAVKGCDGVFHVATPMEFGVAVEDNIGKFFQLNTNYKHITCYSAPFCVTLDFLVEIFSLNTSSSFYEFSRELCSITYH